MSSGALERIDSRPRGMSVSEEERWFWTWERRCRAARSQQSAWRTAEETVLSEAYLGT